MERIFTALITKTEQGFVGIVPSLRACYAQGKTEDELMESLSIFINLNLKTMSREELDILKNTSPREIVANVH